MSQFINMFQIILSPMIGAFRVTYECLGGSKNTGDVLLKQIVIYT